MVGDLVLRSAATLPQSRWVEVAQVTAEMQDLISKGDLEVRHKLHPDSLVGRMRMLVAEQVVTPRVVEAAPVVEEVAPVVEAAAPVIRAAAPVEAVVARLPQRRMMPVGMGRLMDRTTPTPPPAKRTVPPADGRWIAGEAGDWENVL